MLGAGDCRDPSVTVPSRCPGLAGPSSQTLVVPFPAGGNTDVIARAIALDLSEKLGKQFVVDNRAGAGGNIGGAAVAKAKPDGYTLLFATPAPAALNKLMYKSMPYDPERDLDPIILVAKSPLIITAKPALSAANLKDLIALRQGQSGQGQCRPSRQWHSRSHHLGAAAASDRCEDDERSIPRQLPTDDRSAGGQIDVAMDFMTTYVPLVKEGKLKPLAVTSSVRAPELPDVPTAQELGFAGFEATAWYAVVAPKGTPAEIVQTMNRTINAWLSSEKGKQNLEQNGMQAAGGTPADLKTYIADELREVGPRHQGRKYRDVTSLMHKVAVNSVSS